MIHRRAFWGFIALAAIASGCAGPSATRLNPDFEPIRFVSDPIPLRLAQVSLTQKPRAVGLATPVDADFVVSLEEIARFWPSQRLNALGGPNHGEYVIDTASAVSRRNPDGGEIIFGTIQVRLVITDRAGGSELGFVGARVESEVRIDGDPGTAQRQEILHGMAIEMADKLDESLTLSISNKLRSLIDGNIANLQRRERERASAQQRTGTGRILSDLRTQVVDAGELLFGTQEGN